MQSLKLKALLIGIDLYPDPKFLLQGCKNDVFAISSYLKEHCKANNIYLDMALLLDKEATRENIVNTFQNHFKNLEDEDLALFYFSGHGSFITSPSIFLHNNLNNYLGTYVFYDSRIKGNRDFIDKELSYLTWSVSRGKNIIFTVIEDCCHGGNKNFGRHYRLYPQKNLKLDWKDFLGASYYYSDRFGNIHAPSGRIIHLAATEHSQVSYELQIGSNKYMGAFTSKLIHTARQNDYKLTYEKLKSIIQRKINKLKYKQTVSLTSAYPKDTKYDFLCNSSKMQLSTNNR